MTNLKRQISTANSPWIFRINFQFEERIEQREREREREMIFTRRGV